MNTKSIFPSKIVHSKNIIREPIVDHRHNIFAYELLPVHLSTNIETFPTLSASDDLEHLNKLMVSEIEKIPEHLVIFTHFPASSFLHVPAIANRVVEEVEFINSFKSFGDSITRLKRSQIRFCSDHDVSASSEVVTYIKFKAELPIIRTLLKIKKVKHSYPKSKIVVSDIASDNVFCQLQNAGCDYFQGKYISRQLLKKAKSEDKSSNVSFNLLVLVLDKQVSFISVLKKTIQDTDLTFKFLLLINALFKKKKIEFTTLEQALNRLGENVLRKVVLITLMSELDHEDIKPLSITSLTRAHFISAMLKAKRVKYAGSGYLTGLLSLLDSMLDEDIETIVFQLHLPSDVMRALLDHHGILGNLLLICKMMESHKWFDVNKLCQEYDWCVDQVINKYSNALNFSNGVFMYKNIL
ncbi:hypothetical protein ACM9HF_14835 [Colwellia sp. RE-S-Sl-9]